MSLSSLCPCIYLSDNETCYDCFIKVWKWFVNSKCERARENYELVHPLACLKYMESLQNDIRANAFAAVWENYKDRVETDRHAVRKSVAETKELFIARRCLLVKVHIIPAIHAIFAKHFAMTSDQPDAVAYWALTDCTKCETALDFPPKQLEEWMVEKILGLMVNIKDSSHYAEKSRASFDYCQTVMHEWLKYTPKKRHEVLKLTI